MKNFLLTTLLAGLVSAVTTLAVIDTTGCMKPAEKPVKVKVMT